MSIFMPWRIFAAAAVVCVPLSLFYAQDSQPLGDAARQARLQKSQRDARAKETAAKPNDDQPARPPRRVVTNDDIPEHIGSTLTSKANPRTPDPVYTPPRYRAEASAEQLKSAILIQKNMLASLQREVGSLNESIQHPETCIADCLQRNQRLEAKERRLESLKAQIEQLQKLIEYLQDAARKQGFGSAVYDP
jgi:DNA repair exonuclease SbcCD ATPase subunit